MWHSGYVPFAYMGVWYSNSCLLYVWGLDILHSCVLHVWECGVKIFLNIKFSLFLKYRYYL